MVYVSRRQLLALAPAGLAIAALNPRLQARAEGVSDHDRLLANTVAMFAGTGEVNTHPAAAESLQRIHDTARTRLGELEDAGPGEVFAGVPLGEDEANLSTTLQRLYQIALATRTPDVDSDLVDNAEVRARVLDELHRVHTDYLADTGAGYYGNWYAWEIGIPTHLTMTLVLLAQEADPDRIEDYVAVMDDYLRNGKDGDVDLNSRFHTGANLADITTNRILQGALTGDQHRMSKAVSDQATAYATIDPYDLQHGVTDGYYEDGSFIQHHTVAYTGSYGRTLLTRVLQTIKILDGTDEADSESTDLADVVFDWIADGFAPLIFEGWMMEAVKGRAVARTNSGYDDVGSIAEAVVDLVDHSSPDRADALTAYVKHLGTAAANPPATTSWASPVSVVRHAQIMADDAVTPADLNPERAHFAFNAMDRTVHRRGSYAFALSRSSDRISKYEYMNGENLQPWFSGDGAFHLYLAGQNQEEAYGAEFLAVVSPYRLPGVSAPDEVRQTIPELYGEFWYENPDHPLEFTSSSESQNDYVYFPLGTNTHSGGATLEGFGSAAMVLSDDVAYADKQAGILPEDFVVYGGLRGAKSWFTLDEAIVVLSAGIHDPLGRGSVTTTLDAKVAGPDDEVLLTAAGPDGEPWRGGSQPLSWLRWENATSGVAVAYSMLEGPAVQVDHEVVTGNLQSIRASNPDTEVTRQVFTATVEHGDPGLAYAIVPGGSDADAQAYRDGKVVVAANTEQMQAVRHPDLGITAMNTFTDGEHVVRLLSVEGPACVLMREDTGQVHLAVSDPTMTREQITLTLRGGRAPQVIDADEGVQVEADRGSTRITVTTHEAYGRTFTVSLARY